MALPRLCYQTLVFRDTDIHLCTLRDRQQFHDPDNVAASLGISPALWPLFGVVWPSSLALADFIDGYDTGRKRILEVGCGIALPSLLLNARCADITATDQHPEAAAFLLRNTALNHGATIAFERTGWADHNDRLGLFDLIIASDVLYEHGQVELLAAFINAHAHPVCEVIVVDPGRGRKSKLVTAMKALGYGCSYQLLPKSTEPGRQFSGHILKFVRPSLLPDAQ